MLHRWLTAFAGVVCLSLAGCSLAQESARTQARTVFRVLYANEEAYQQVLESEASAIALARHWVDEGGEAPEREIVEAEGKLADLRKVLGAAPARGRIRTELLDPILRQLHRQEQELHALRDAVGSSEEDAKAVLDRHDPVVNLFTPAIRKLRDVYRVVRQRNWRGHPLTA